MLILAVLILAISQTVSSEPWGRYFGTVVAEWGSDGRTMTLKQPFTYVDPNGVIWEAPPGSRVDGASIPRFFWTSIGGPFEGPYRDASVIHDVACVQKSRPWRDVHRAFYTAMRASAVGRIQAKIMYAAVFHFGPRWAEGISVLACERIRATIVCPKASRSAIPPRNLSEQDFTQLQAEIVRRDSLEARGPGDPLEL
jgi:hypothetical protein